MGKVDAKAEKEGRQADSEAPVECLSSRTKVFGEENAPGNEFWESQSSSDTGHPRHKVNLGLTSSLSPSQLPARLGVVTGSL